VRGGTGQLPHALRDNIQCIVIGLTLALTLQSLLFEGSGLQNPLSTARVMKMIWFPQFMDI
jgi:hypothetical protein